MIECQVQSVFCVIEEESILKKLGVVELNTTVVRLIIADVLDNESFVVSERVENSIQIASDIVGDQLIKTANIQSLCDTLKSYKSLCSANGVVEFFAVASDEYLDAKNQRSFFDELYSASGFKFKILSQDEGLNNLYLAFINSLDCPKGLIVSINGTNTEIFGYNRRNTVEQCFAKIGSVTLADKYTESKLSPEKVMENMVNDFAEQIKSQDWFNSLDEETQIVGTGDAFISLARLSRKLKHYPYNREHSYQFTIADFNKVYDFVKTLDIDKTKRLKGISNERADVLASNLAIIKAVAQKSGIENFIVSENGIAEGLLFAKVCPLTLEKPISDVLGYSLDTLNSYYNNFAVKNTKNVYELSLVLFKQLKVLHKLPRSFVRVLRVASYMHDSGRRISNIDYQKKGFDVVLGSDLYGLNQHEQVLSAFTVACQNLDDFSMTDWVKYSSMLSETDLEGVRKLAIIVKLASSLDKFGLGKIKDVSCDILGDSVIMKTIVDGGATLEISEGLKVCGDFAKAFKKHLEIL